MKNNPLKQLRTFGQSVWLDYIRRDLIAAGALRRLIEEDGLWTVRDDLFSDKLIETLAKR